mmetsp:Transcript_28312/g.50477  ORF Transcript_28312/g.50477 Transcript_28312/m.50477 type:complete len:177 (+) Transcript_28312:561-1091(+)
MLSEKDYTYKLAQLFIEYVYKNKLALKSEPDELQFMTVQKQFALKITMGYYLSVGLGFACLYRVGPFHRNHLPSALVPIALVIPASYDEMKQIVSLSRKLSVKYEAELKQLNPSFNFTNIDKLKAITEGPKIDSKEPEKDRTEEEPATQSPLEEFPDFDPYRLTRQSNAYFRSKQL